MDIQDMVDELFECLLEEEIEVLIEQLKDGELKSLLSERRSG